MSTENKSIRDFIYLDGDRLNSLYSQVFEGVAEEIVKAKLHGEIQKDTQSGGITKGQIAEAQFSEFQQSTESKVLYDYMYAQLESGLKEAILEPSELTTNNYREKLIDAFMVKVIGKAEVEDYDRIKIFAENFNELVSSFAYAETVNALGMNIYQLEALIPHLKGESKTTARDLVQKLKNPAKLAQSKNYSQDPQLLSLISDFTEMFYPKGFEISVTPVTGTKDIVFRCVVDRSWLRLKPETLKALYGGYTEFNWTLVGQITYMPGSELPEIPQVNTSTISEVAAGLETSHEDTQEGEPTESNASSPGENESPKNEVQQGVTQNFPSMRDPFRNAFGMLRQLERVFLESQQRTEIIVHPLAIYREVTIPVKKDQ